MESILENKNRKVIFIIFLYKDMIYKYIHVIFSFWIF